MKKQYRLTQQGVDELKKELDNLVNSRKDIADRIKTAREFGDLAENGEYQTARADQEKAEARISELEHILQNVELITAPKGDSKVQLGSRVKLVDGDAAPKEFQVVGTVEADPLNGKISDDSPIGQALLGKKVGDDVEIKTPAGAKTYQVAEIA